MLLDLHSLLTLNRGRRAWREKQAEEIRARDERSKAKREETIVAAEKAIDDFYNSYNNEKEKNISRNKCVAVIFIKTSLRVSLQ